MITRAQAKRLFESGLPLRTLPVELILETAKYLSANDADQLSATAPDFAELLRPMYKHYLLRDFNLVKPEFYEAKLYYHVVAIHDCLEYIFLEADSDFLKFPSIPDLYEWFSSHNSVKVVFQFGGEWLSNRSIIISKNLNSLISAKQKGEEIYDERLNQAELSAQKIVDKGYSDADDAFEIALDDFNGCAVSFEGGGKQLLYLRMVRLNLLIFRY